LPAIEPFLKQLLRSQQRLQQAGITQVDPSLVLGEALLRYQRLYAKCEQPPLHLVVVGPTQAGKSSVVNWLLDTEVAGVNALAGYTRHAQGFTTAALSEAANQCIEQYFSGWEKSPQADLTGQLLEAYSLELVTSRTQLSGQPLVIWDSPDFDSVSSRSYRNVVLKQLAMADMVLFVVSKEKYADQTVWNTLKLIQPLQLPLLLCINKIPPGSADELTTALRQRLDHEQIDASIIDLPYQQDAESTQLISAKLVQSVTPVLDQISSKRSVNAAAFLKQHWQQWVAPLQEELAQHEVWQQKVDDALVVACQAYQDNYLRAPLYAETMQQAVVRLLELLEIPGLADTLGRARHVLTWPARKLRGIFSTGSVQLSAQERQSRETVILEEVVAQALISLQHAAAQQIGQPDSQNRHWWTALSNELTARDQGLRNNLQVAVKNYQEDFADNIEQAAQELYRHLQKHPAALNSLRIARVTVDAAAVVLALKTGGIGLNDLVLTPAMLSFTSFLTEGAVGQYMQNVEKQLKHAQQQAVCGGLLQEQLHDRLLNIPDAMSQQTTYGISAEQLEEAKRAIQYDD
jgi:GTPase SAR1 family protein